MTESSGRSLICDGALVLHGDVGEARWADIEGFTASDVLFALAELGVDRDVTVRINSGGGNAFEGLAIHAILTAHRGKVTTLVEGVAASAASIIAMAGTERIMSPGSLMMVHDPAGLTVGTADDHDESAAFLRTLADTLASVYATATGRTKAAILAEMKAETWLTPSDAVAKRYATKVGSATAATASAPFPFRAYAKAPQRLVALADAKGWSRRTFTASDAAGPRSPRASASKGKTMGASRAQEITELCLIAGQPTRAAGHIAAGTAPAAILAELRAEQGQSGPQPDSLAARMARTQTAVADARRRAEASMGRTLKAQGIEPKADPGAGLPPAQASMYRILARQGR
ncbi:head maturation protease, ClpP-related [Methylobacterium planeticum]|uniref:head maturation protease, ClpP-related n=1 Tax=Methylobacterium planeticum TaxID=2615211 RepID=UPI0017865A03|nr:head maturation protease, ClpP-related [Methylobacterium planeticum]